jgi:hypothetical protein
MRSVVRALPTLEFMIFVRWQSVETDNYRHNASREGD